VSISGFLSAAVTSRVFSLTLPFPGFIFALMCRRGSVGVNTRPSACAGRGKFDRSGKTARVVYGAPPDLHAQVAEVLESLVD
jgi:hypothetical protein